MRSIPRKSLAFVVRFGVILWVLAAAPRVQAQFCASSQSLPPVPNQTSKDPHGLLNDSSKYEPPTALNSPEMRAKLVNEDRHKKLLADSKRLLELAQALSEEVQATPKDELNVDVVKKAAEMEKLARDLKDRMRY